MSRLLSCLLLHTSTHKEARTNLFMHNFYKLNYWLTGIQRTVLFHTLIVQSYLLPHTHSSRGEWKGNAWCSQWCQSDRVPVSSGETHSTLSTILLGVISSSLGPKPPLLQGLRLQPDGTALQEHKQQGMLVNSTEMLCVMRLDILAMLAHLMFGWWWLAMNIVAYSNKPCLQVSTEWTSLRLQDLNLEPFLRCDLS